ncbi:MAG: acetyl-CoA C-acetyltransferase [Hyphomicrobiaceae bacterium]|nr:acetyl-CoA C-acetyltransferase [Hyphomicrobiaceae bacterium]
MNQIPRRVAIVGGIRIPFCRSNTFYSDLSNLAMMTTTINGLSEKFNLKGLHIDEVVGGAVVTHSKNWNLTREAVIGSDLATSTPGITMIQACGTSLQAATGIAAKIAFGAIECGIAIGSDTTSDVPIVVSEKLSRRLIKFAARTGVSQRIKAFKGLTLRELVPQPMAVVEPRTGLSMGQHCELMAQEWQVSREAQDQFTADSHSKASAAYSEGFMDDMIVPCAGIYRDNNIREDIDLERLGALNNVFEKSTRGTLSAANSTPLTDGAASILLASEDWANAHDLPIQAYLTNFQTSANNFVDGEGLLLAPTIAVSRMLDRSGLLLQDFDYYEIHEAFAAQVLATLKAWEDPEYCKKIGRDSPMGHVDLTKLNVKGSSLAIGHPFAATGARIIANLANLLYGQNDKRGLISICTAGGMGVAAILEGVRKA